MRTPLARQRQPDDFQNLIDRGGVWYVRYKLAGKQVWRSTGETDVRKARKVRDRLLSEASDSRRGIIRERENTWQDAVDGYLKLAESHVREGSLSEKTSKRYETSIVQLTVALAGEPDKDGETNPIPLSAITVGTITDFILARKDEERSASTIKNDLTAMSRVLAYATGRQWIDGNVAKLVDRKMFVGTSADTLNPPTDDETAELIDEVSAWNSQMALLLRWLRETGMRLGEALNLRVQDIHPDGLFATLVKGVKRDKPRTINLGRAAELVGQLSRSGRLFGELNADSAVTSTRYGQWRRQRQGRENREASDEGRDAELLETFRIHDLRHAYAIASLIDDPTCIYRLSEHLGHSSVKTTEVYLRFLRGAGAHRRHSRRTDLFGSLPADVKG